MTLVDTPEICCVSANFILFVQIALSITVFLQFQIRLRISFSMSIDKKGI
jgi:hypothetical protein